MPLSLAWHKNGRELFLLSLMGRAGRQRMMAVEFTPGSPSGIGRPRELFTFEGHLFVSCTPVRCYDVAADGQRFYAVKQATPPPPPVVTHINLIPDWVEELKAKVPTGR